MLYATNAKLDEDNNNLNELNKKLDAEIIMIVRRVEVNNLLADIDIEDLRHMATNTYKMN